MSHVAGTTIKPLVKLPRNPADCWVWLGTVDPNGYARKQHRRRCMTAARWMWETLWGALPEALVVVTTCGNRQCCNPSHLRAETFTEAKRNGQNTILLPGEVSEIRQARKTKTMHTANHLAERHGVHPATIRAIWKGQLWRRATSSSERSVSPAAGPSVTA
jgi:hypothetical protein